MKKKISLRFDGLYFWCVDVVRRLCASATTTSPTKRVRSFSISELSDVRLITRGSPVSGLGANNLVLRSLTNVHSLWTNKLKLKNSKRFPFYLSLHFSSICFIYILFLTHYLSFFLFFLSLYIFLGPCAYPLFLFLSFFFSASFVQTRLIAPIQQLFQCLF